MADKSRFPLEEVCVNDVRCPYTPADKCTGFVPKPCCERKSVIKSLT